MADRKVTKELRSTSRRQEAHSLVFLCHMLLFYTCSSWFCFLLNVSSSPAAAAF